MKILASFILIISSLLLMVPDVSSAQCGPGPGRLQCEYRGRPYGNFGRGLYGRRMPVTSAQEAKKVIEVYFAGLDENVSTGKVDEGHLFFEVEVIAKDGTIIDKVIVDKRTGRFRSTY